MAETESTEKRAVAKQWAWIILSAITCFASVYGFLASFESRVTAGEIRSELFRENLADITKRVDSIREKLEETNSRIRDHITSDDSKKKWIQRLEARVDNLYSQKINDKKRNTQSEY